MLHEKWFVSDTHFFHANILKFLRNDGKRLRHEFHNLEDMHEYMVSKWNENVKDNDYVYHLGDVTFQYHAGFNNLMSRLKGKKRLIVGNHDAIWNPALMRWFEKVDLWKGFKEHNFTASHMPLRIDGFRDGAFNVHGHVHANSLVDKRYINVSVEVRGYSPVHLDTIGKEIKDANVQL
jgi:calcineurin-like phosphoesterase family protein